MYTYIIRRLLYLIPILIGVAFISFMIMHLIPGDPARVIAGLAASEQDVIAIRARLGLDRSLPEQFGTFLLGLAQGDLGRSLRTRQPVLREIQDRFFATMSLAFMAMAFGIIISIPLGIFAATKQYSIFDNISMVAAVGGLSAPSFWLGLMLMYYLAYRIRIFPPSGMGGYPWTWVGFKSYVLPAITLGIPSAAMLARLTRSSILEVLRQDYIRTARSKGLSSRVVLYRHALRNAAIPILTMGGIQLGYMLGGAVVVETVFSWPGLGRYIVSAIHFRDFPIVQGGVMFLALTFVFVNLIVDIMYGIIDPRIRYD